MEATLMKAEHNAGDKRASSARRLKNSPVQPPLLYGFTLVELLVVIAIIAILASMLLPVLGKAKLKAQGIYCMNNHRSLMLAWRMYSDDNGDRFPLASCLNTSSPELPSAWVTGFLDFTPGNQSNWNLDTDIYKSPLYRYAPSPAIFRCPADRSVVKVPGKGILPRVRTMTMNQHVGGVEKGATGWWLLNLRFFKKASELTEPGPSKTWLFIDERDDYGNFPSYEVAMDGWPNKPEDYSFTDKPGFYHNGAGGMSFTDGHSEIRRWVDPRTRDSGPLHEKSANNQDIRWMQERTTRPIP
jgi:prepilin-type N-terminal cleavage/methylation domain-containing protein